MDFAARYALALGLTIVVETLLACAVRPRQARRLVVDVPLFNLFTHPLLHLGMRHGLPVGLGELLVMIVETSLYRGVTRLRLVWALVLGTGLNVVTWMLGIVFQSWF